MQWCSALSDNPVLEKAIEECSNKTIKELQTQPDLSVLFISNRHSRGYDQIVPTIRQHLKPRNLIGCSAGGVIGGGREVEERAAVSLTSAVLPEVRITPFHVTKDSMPGMDDRPKFWQDLVGVTPDKENHFIVLADPYSIDADKFVMGMDYAFSKSTKVGGLASGGHRPRENALFLNDQLYREGLVGIGLSGNITVDSVVAQGCRPIGEPHLVTACESNVLLELDNSPPMKILEDMFESLSPRDQQLLRTSLFLGIVMNPTMTNLSRGDFLIRNILGADPEKGILAIGTELRKGQTVQFHLRDAETSAEDLSLMLSGYSTKNDKKNVRGSLLFSCMGRGVYLYGTPNHDTKIFHKKIGDVPLGGFFCNGEVGPVRNTTYIHGYTSCFGIFREKETA